MKPEFNYVTFIDAPRKKVWQALTDPAFTKNYWFNTEVQSDWKVGSKVSYVLKDGVAAVSGEVVKIDEPNELVYTFQAHAHEEAKDEVTTVQFLLEKAGETTKLSVRHYDFEEGTKLLESISNGWPLILSGLKTYLESDKVLKTSDE